jgi:hypothetical protein
MRPTFFGRAFIGFDDSGKATGSRTSEIFVSRATRPRARGIDPVTGCDSLISSRDFDLPTLIDINGDHESIFAKKRSTLAAAIILTQNSY